MKRSDEYNPYYPPSENPTPSEPQSVAGVASLGGGARQAFAELLKKVAEKNPAGVSDVWIDAAKFGWEAGADYAFEKAGEELVKEAEHIKSQQHWSGAPRECAGKILSLAARLRQMQGKP